MTHCPNCPFKHHRGACESEPHSSGRPLLALIGEAPGFTELREGRPFSPNGASGRLLAATLRELGVGRSECWIGNAVNCDARTSRDLDKAQPACSDRLIAELQELPASAVIVPLGSSALKTVLGRRAASILKFRGAVIKLEAGPLAGRTVVSTIHPAYALRVPAYQNVMLRDIERALSIQERGWESPETSRPLRIARSLGELEAELSALGLEVAFDVETTFDPPMWNDLICFGISDGRRTVVVPWSSHRDGTGCVWANPGAATSIVSAHLQQRTTIMHNGPQFDQIVAARYGIKFGEIEDTLIAWHALHGTLPKNLGFVASYYVEVPPWKTYEDKTADLPRLYVYNGRDALFSKLAWDGVKAELAEAA